MYRVFSGLPFGIISVMFYLLSFNHKVNSDTWDLCVFVYVIAFLVFLIFMSISFIDSFVKHAEQLKRFEEIREKFNRITIRKKKQSTLIEDLKLHTNEYRKFEKEIYEMIKPGNLSTYFVQFPELKGSEIVQILINEITKIEGQLCDEDFNIESTYKDIRVCYNNPWYLKFILPKMPEELETKVKERLNED